MLLGYLRVFRVLIKSAYVMWQSKLHRLTENRIGGARKKRGRAREKFSFNGCLPVDFSGTFSAQLHLWLPGCGAASPSLSSFKRKGN